VTASHRSTAIVLAEAVRTGETTASAAIETSLARARDIEELHAFLSLREEDARREAAEVDRRVSAGEGPKLPLAGVPVAVKDNIAVAGGATTCGSRLLERYVSPFDATAIARLRAAGAIVVGKTNLDEFAMGSSTENSAFGPSRNPHDPTRVPGGSSGGSVVAVAAGCVPVALGSETGGSVRQPAAFCGTVGVKPTYGRVSRSGLVAFGSSLDQIGTVGATVEDAALLLKVIAGSDPRDATSAPDVVGNLSAGLDAWDAAGARIGWPAEYFGEGLDPAIRAACEAARDALAAAGAEIVDVSLPHSPYGIAVYYTVAIAEASSNLARYDGVRYGHRTEAGDLSAMYLKTRAAFGAELKRRIMLGTYVLSAGYYEAFYGKGTAVRARIRGDFEQAFDRVDAILCPTTPTPAFPIGEKADDPLAMYLNETGRPCRSASSSWDRTSPSGGCSRSRGSWSGRRPADERPLPRRPGRVAPGAP
jgi:aspartyl-tRNA(Asn)/glutamyl-tRNA(Gln) amidotransferase subunit A